MRLVALDLETSGRDPQTHQILQLGAVVFDTETRETLGEFERVVHHSNILGEPVALAMNEKIIRQISKEDAHYWPSVKSQFTEFLCEFALSCYGDHISHRPVAVGFNVGPFDVAFLNRVTNVPWFSHRTIELGSLLMPMFGSHAPVASKDAAKMLNKDDLDHTALQDARDARDLYFHWLDFLESVKDNRLCLP